MCLLCEGHHRVRQAASRMKLCCAKARMTFYMQAISNMREPRVFRLLLYSAQDLSPCPFRHARPWHSRNKVLTVCEGYGVASIRQAEV
jgi:hypothetical protein